MNYEYTNKWVGGSGYIIIFNIDPDEMRALGTLDFPEFPKSIHVRIQEYQKSLGLKNDPPTIVKFSAEKQVQLFIYHEQVFKHFEKEFNDLNLQIFLMRE